MKANNVIVLAGNVVSISEVRKVGDSEVLTVRMAVDAGKDKTLFMDVECWENNATFASKYFKKGSSVSAVGTLCSREYEKDGQKRTAYSVRADNISFNGPKSSEDKNGGEAETPAQAQRSGKTSAPRTQTKSDDLPF